MPLAEKAHFDTRSLLSIAIKSQRRSFMIVKSKDAKFGAGLSKQTKRTRKQILTAFGEMCPARLSLSCLLADSESTIIPFVLYEPIRIVYGTSERGVLRCADLK